MNIKDYKVKVVTSKGNTITLEQWQVIYNLPVHSDKIGKYFSLSEKRFTNDLTAYGELTVNELLMLVLDAFREAIGGPITINSFNRSEEHQLDLKRQGLKAATFSPHVAKMAADIDTKSPEQTREWVKVLQKVSASLGIKIRIGYEQYLKAGQTFIHVDVCPEYFAPGKPFNKMAHPAVWEQVITW